MEEVRINANVGEGSAGTKLSHEGPNKVLLPDFFESQATFICFMDFFTDSMAWLRNRPALVKSKAFLKAGVSLPQFFC